MATPTKPTMAKVEPTAALFFRNEFPDPVPVRVPPLADTVVAGTVELKRRLDVRLWVSGRLVVVGDGDDVVLDVVLLVDWDEEDEVDGIELEELEIVEDGSGDGSGVEVGCVWIEEAEVGPEEGSCVSKEGVGETGEGDTPCGLWVGETTGLGTGGELLVRPWRLCSRWCFSSTSSGIAYTIESE